MMIFSGKFSCESNRGFQWQSGQMLADDLKTSVKSVDPFKNPCFIRENPWLKEKSNLDSTNNTI